MTALVAAGSDVGAVEAIGQTPLMLAAGNIQSAQEAVAAMDLLVASGADLRAKDVVFGEGVLHYAVMNPDVEAAVATAWAAAAAGADVRARSSSGLTPLSKVLQMAPAADVAQLLAMESWSTDAVLEDLDSAAMPDSTRQLLPDFIARRAPLTAAQWASVWALLPAPGDPCPGLGRALPAALACSADQATQVVRRLPPADSQRLRTFALCVTRVQQDHHSLWPLYLPPAVAERILSMCDA